MKPISLIAIILLTAFIVGCKDEKGEDPAPQPNYLYFLTNENYKAWDFVSFKIDGVEKLSQLQMDTCFQPIAFMDDDTGTVYGFHNHIYCIFNGTWNFKNSYKVLSLSIPFMGYSGFGPWNEGLFNEWSIVELSPDTLIINLNYQGSDYLINFKPY